MAVLAWWACGCASLTCENTVSPTASQAHCVRALVTLALINPGVGSLTGGVVASVFTAGFFALLALVPGRGLGWGDVKFQAGLGFYLGFVHPGWEIVQVMTAFFLGSLQGLGMVFSRRGSVRDPIAFGPWMMAGVCLSIIWAQSPEII